MRDQQEIAPRSRASPSKVHLSTELDQIKTLEDGLVYEKKLLMNVLKILITEAEKILLWD